MPEKPIRRKKKVEEGGLTAAEKAKLRKEREKALKKKK